MSIHAFTPSFDCLIEFLASEGEMQEKVIQNEMKTAEYNQQIESLQLNLEKHKKAIEMYMQYVSDRNSEVFEGLEDKQVQER